MHAENIEGMIAQYIETALWSTNDNSRDDGGDPLDKNYGPEDLSPECFATMERDVRNFYAANWQDIGGRFTDAGHDFWLTRNGHGCGFWETPDWPADAGKRLTAACKTFGEVYLYVGDDGRIHC